MTYFMNYSPDWPSPPAPARRRWRLQHWCLFWALVYAAIIVGGLVAIHLTHADYLRFNPDRPVPASGTAAPGKTEAHR